MNEDEIIHNLKQLLFLDDYRRRLLKEWGREPFRPVVDRADVTELEKKIGFELPRILVRVLTEVSNGGIGPGDGLFGIPPNGWSTVTNEFPCLNYREKFKQKVKLGEKIYGYDLSKFTNLKGYWIDGFYDLCFWDSYPGMRTVVYCRDSDFPVYTIDLLGDEIDQKDKKAINKYHEFNQIPGGIELSASNISSWFVGMLKDEAAIEESQ